MPQFGLNSGRSGLHLTERHRRVKSYVPPWLPAVWSTRNDTMRPNYMVDAIARWRSSWHIHTRRDEVCQPHTKARALQGTS